MKIKSKKFFWSIMILAVLGWAGSVYNFPAGAEMTSDNGYRIWADTLAGGAVDNSVSTNDYRLFSTLGEQIIDVASSTNYGVKQGFQAMQLDESGSTSLSLSFDNYNISLGTLSKTNSQTTSHKMTVATNAPAGFSVTVSGNALSNGSHVFSTNNCCTAGTEFFGLKLSDPTGTAPIGSISSAYQSYKFSSGEVVAYSSGAVNQTEYTISYLANIGDATPSGNYTTTLNYLITANF